MPPLSPRVAVRAAEYTLPAGLVAELDVRLREHGSEDRLDEVLEELTRIRARVRLAAARLADRSGDRLAGASPRPLRPALALRRRRAARPGRGAVRHPSGRGRRRRCGAPSSCSGDGVERAEEPPEALEELREDAEGLAASEEELLLLALYGEDAEPLLRSVRSRGRRDESETAGLAPGEAERLREIIRVVQESGIGEVTIEEGEMRVTVRRTDERADGSGRSRPVPTAPVARGAGTARPSRRRTTSSASSRRWSGTFYRAPQPGAAPFVEEGDTVESGQTLCILEAMKLMNEVKADSEGVVRRVCVENAAPVQYGDLLFELEPLNGRPLDAL